MEWPRQVIPRPRDGDVMLLHRLKQRRLGARTGPIDLVGHQQLSEDRTLDETERPLAVVTFLHHLGAENVGGDQIRRELHPQSSARAAAIRSSAASAYRVSCAGSAILVTLIYLSFAPRGG